MNEFPKVDSSVSLENLKFVLEANPFGHAPIETRRRGASQLLREAFTLLSGRPTARPDNHRHVVEPGPALSGRELDRRPLVTSLANLPLSRWECQRASSSDCDSLDTRSPNPECQASVLRSGKVRCHSKKLVSKIGSSASLAAVWTTRYQ